MPTYKDNTTNKWYCKFYYTDYEGNKKQKKKSGFNFKKDAQEWERDFLLSKQFEPDMPFEAFLEIYKKDKYPKLRISSRDKKQCRYKRILPYFQNMPLNKISNKDISNWQNKMIELGFRSTYIKGLQGEISAVLNHAVRFYGLRINPCKIVGYAKVPDEIPTKMRYWTYDEYLKAIDNITDLKSKTAINLLYWTGMRKGELYALTWDKLDLDNKTILIDRSLQRINGKSIVTTTKTYESRIVKLPDTTIDQLKEYKDHCYNIDPSDYVFDWDELLNFEGETGPYVHYTYARAKSVLRKAGKENFGKINFEKLNSEEEYSLIKALESFQDAVILAKDRLEPAVVARKVMEIAQKFNKFYNSTQILVDDEKVKEERLALTKATSIVIKNGLGILGIKTVEQM